MDWFFKTTTWDFGEFQSQPDTSIISSNKLNDSSLKKKGDCSVDLKLGRIDGLLDTGSGTQSEIKASKPDLPKRVRKMVISSQNIACSVDGCKSDLSGCRDYHKRHKVCEAHAKTPIVMVDGLRQRFCQQCSRFHLLKEFDETKRSCRRRLDGHNRRRRKIQVDVESANYISFFHESGDAFGLVPETWSGNRIIDACPGSSSTKDHLSFNYLEQHTLFPHYSDNPTLSSGYQLHPNRITSSDSNSALSLLSISNPSFGINAVGSLQAERIPMAHPLIQTTKCFTTGNGDDLCIGKSSSQVSNYISTSSVVCVERENQFRCFNEESNMDIAGVQSVYSPPSNAMSAFWTS